MSHSVKRSKSHIEQFRMVVPKDVRGVIGKTEWTESLRTTDHLIACTKRADLVARYTAEIAAARAGIAAAQAEIARQAEVDAVALLDQAFQRLAKARGSMDRAIQLQLQLLANLVVDSWAGAGQDLGEQWWGDFLVREPVICDEPVPLSIANASARSIGCEPLCWRGAASSTVSCIKNLLLFSSTGECIIRSGR
jgi:hypothetical protein